jgi:carbon-monoxide dehydrogenase medium subunit
MSDSRIITKDFEYFPVNSADEAVQLLSTHGRQAKIIAGGTDILVGMKLGKIEPDYLIGVQDIPGIGDLEETGKGVRIGAGCTFHQVEASPVIKQRYQALYEAAKSVSSLQIKNMGTIGGNLCNASPASDSAPALLVLGALVKIRGPGRDRLIGLGDLFVGPGETSLAEDEMLTEIQLPPPLPGAGSAFQKIARVSADLAKVNVAVFVGRKGAHCLDCRIALGSVAKTAVRAKEAESIMKGHEFNEKRLEAVALKASEEIAPITDLRSSEEYRRAVSKVITRRALLKAWDRAGG